MKPVWRFARALLPFLLAGLATGCLARPIKSYMEFEEKAGEQFHRLSVTLFRPSWFLSTESCSMELVCLALDGEGRYFLALRIEGEYDAALPCKWHQPSSIVDDRGAQPECLMVDNGGRIDAVITLRREFLLEDRTLSVFCEGEEVYRFDFDEAMRSAVLARIDPLIQGLEPAKMPPRAWTGVQRE